VAARGAGAGEQRSPASRHFVARNAEEAAPNFGTLEQGLKDLGYFDGRTIKLEHRFPYDLTAKSTGIGPGSLEWFEPLAAELAALKVDAVVTVGDRGALAAQHATRTIPIVFIQVGDPIKLKLVDSLARPGGNATGLTDYDQDLSGKRLSLFKEAFPRMTRVALLVRANDQHNIDQYQTAASALGLSIQPVEVRSREEFERAFDMIADARLEGIMMPPSGFIHQNQTLILRLALMHRLPLMGGIARMWKPVRSCLMGPTSAQLTAARPSTLIRFSRERNRPTSPSNSPQRSSLS